MMANLLKQKNNYEEYTMNTESMTIKQSALRIIANAILYSNEKKKKCNEYRFDGAFLRKVGIVTVFDIDALSKELSLLGWTLTMIDLNNYAVQLTCYIMKNMLKLSDSRVSKLSNKEINLAVENGVKEKDSTNEDDENEDDPDSKYNLSKLGFYTINDIKAEYEGTKIKLYIDGYIGTINIGVVDKECNFELLSDAIKRGASVKTTYAGRMLLSIDRRFHGRQQSHIRVYYKFYPGANILIVSPLDTQDNVEWDISKMIEVTKVNKRFNS
jgi:hypothetical protein